MARVTAERVAQSKLELLEAARAVLVAEGYSGLSTRRVAEAAGTQMSQIQYHFGSKEGLILALFEHMNARLIDRQTATFARDDLTVSEKWDRACDYLDDDIASGYVRVTQELIAAGWSNPALSAAVRAALSEWHGVLEGLASEAEALHGPLAPFTTGSIASLIASAFLGAEALILLGYEDRTRPVRDALRQIGTLIAMAEARNQGG